jgi:hypothetical protein
MFKRIINKLIGIEKPKPVELYGLDNLDDDVIGYPPNPQGIPVVQPAVLFSRMNKEIELIRHQLGIKHDAFDEYIAPVMVSFLEYADLLPASEYKHHSTGGGLIYHSFDVAKRAMRMAQVTQFPIGTGTVADTQQSNGRWKAGTVLAALLHDGGKILADVEVSNGENGETRIVWDAQSDLTIQRWASQHKIERYYVSWRKQRHQKHQNASLMVMQRLIPQKTWSWLQDCYDGKEIHSAMLSSVAKTSFEHPMSKVIAECDSASAKADMFGSHSHITREVKRVALSELLCDLMKHYILTGKWKINCKNAPFWFVNNQLYVVWDSVVPTLIEEMQEAQYTIPAVPDVLARLMIEEGRALGNGDELHFDIYPEILGDAKKPVRIKCLKIRHLERLIKEPEKLYSIKEHPKKAKEGEVAQAANNIESTPSDTLSLNDVLNLGVEDDEAVTIPSKRQKLYESSTETVNRVLALMGSARKEGKVLAEAQPKIVEESPLPDEHIETELSDGQDEGIENITCSIAKFIVNNFDTSVRNGKVVILREDINDIESALGSSGIAGITTFNANNALMSSPEVEICES